MSHFADVFLKVGCFLTFIGYALVPIYAHKPNLISLDVIVVLILLGFVPISLNVFVGIGEFFGWLWNLFK